MGKINAKLYMVFTILMIAVLAHTNAIAENSEKDVDYYEKEYVEDKFLKSHSEIEEMLLNLNYNEITLEEIIRDNWGIELSTMHESDQVNIIVAYIQILNAFVNGDERALENVVEDSEEEFWEVKYYSHDIKMRENGVKPIVDDFDGYMKSLKYRERMIFEEDMATAKELFEKVRKYGPKCNKEFMKAENQIRMWKAAAELSNLCQISLDKYMRNYNMRVNELSEEQCENATKIYRDIIKLQEKEGSWFPSSETEIRNKKIQFLKEIGFNLKNGQPKNHIKSFVEVLEDACDGTINQFNKIPSASKSEVYRYYDYILEDIEKGLWNWIEDDYEELKDAYEDGVMRIYSKPNSRSEVIERQTKGLREEDSKRLKEIYDEQNKISEKISELKEQNLKLNEEIYEILTD